MSKVKKGKRVIAAAMAVALSIATISTGIVPNSVGLVQATEDVTYTKLANSSVDGFYYQKDENGIIYCVSDKRQVYTSYDDAVKSLGELSRKIFLEKKYLEYRLRIPIEIKTDKEDDRYSSDIFDSAVYKDTFKDTGKAEEGHTLFSFAAAKGNFYADDLINNPTYENGSYKGIFYYRLAGYGNKSERYEKAIAKINQEIKQLNLDGKSDYDKFKAITYWIVSNVKYDSHYNGKPNIPAGTEYPHDMTGAVLDGYAVCDGYAGLFYYMANAVGIKALYEDGISIAERKGHEWNLVKLDGVYYYVDPTNAYLKEDGEPGSEVLYGQKYFFSLYTPDSTTIEDTYKNISQDDWLKEHSICKGNHNLRENGGKSAQCTTPATIHYECTNPGCLYEYDVESSPALGHAWDEGKITQEQSCDNPEITTYTCTRSNCKKKKHVETKPALGHTWDDGKVKKEAHCSEKGVKTYKCSS